MLRNILLELHHIMHFHIYIIFEREMLKTVDIKIRPCLRLLNTLFFMGMQEFFEFEL